MHLVTPKGRVVSAGGRVARREKNEWYKNRETHIETNRKIRTCHIPKQNASVMSSARSARVNIWSGDTKTGGRHE
jgi:hypothetical protein